MLQNDTAFAYVGVFSGTPYEIGYAYGQLFSEEMSA